MSAPLQRRIKGSAHSRCELPGGSNSPAGEADTAKTLLKLHFGPMALSDQSRDKESRAPTAFGDDSSG